MTAEEKKRLRELIRSGLRWTRAKSARYATAPHEYIIWHWEDCRAAYVEIAALVRRYGRIGMWRGYKYRFLVLDGCAYWEDQPAMNRSNARNLEHNGHNPGYPCPDAMIDYSGVPDEARCAQGERQEQDHPDPEYDLDEPSEPRDDE